MTPLTLSLLILLSYAASLIAVDPGGDGHGRGSLDWQVLTKKNFSSQIRQHHHVLLFVTLPWDGESRSLMRDVSHMIIGRQEELASLELMVVYRNTERMLADVLHATDGTAVIYYHYSTGYRYQGRLRARNILNSVYHLMSLPSEELPFARLGTLEELEHFSRSTDRAVLLFEFCGWTAKLLEKKNEERRLQSKNLSDNDDIHGDNLIVESNGGPPSGSEKNQKTQELENDKLTCELDNGLSGMSWIGELTSANATSPLAEPENINASNWMSCTLEEYQRFESFFIKFMAVAREYSLPPERQRFGLISERTLLRHLGVYNMDTWLLMLQFSGCSNCSRIIQDVYDLRTYLQMHHPLVTEIEGESYNFKAKFPANTPSIVLFVDKSSELSEIREHSNSALDIYRSFALQNLLTRQKIKGRAGLESISGQAFPQTLGKSISNPSGPVKMKVVPASHLVQLKDKIAFMVEGNRVSLDDAVNLGAQGNPAYDILSQLLHQRSPSLKVKQTKISLIAKEVGFQLLSDDFDVKIIDSSTADTENDQPGHASQAELLSPDVQQSKISLQTTAEGTVDLNDGDSLTVVGITALEDKKEPALVNDETSFRPTSDEKDSWEICTASVQEVMRDKQSVIESMEIGEDARLSKENDNQPASSNAELPFYVDQQSPTEPSLGNNKKENQSHQTDISSVHDTCSHGATIDSCPSDAYEENEILEDKIYPSSNELNDQQAKYNLFDGSFYFSDGGHRMLKALTANSKIPSVVILDPIRQQHYVFPEETDFSYTSLVSFIDRFLNGSLAPYQRSELSIVSPRVTLQPPFVNLDFHETDSIPRITANIFSDLVLGSVHCFQQNEMPGSHCQEADCAWKKDVMVLFSNNWCGFCQRMEVVVREVYRSIKGYYAAMHESGTENKDSLLLEDNSVNVMQNEPPAIFLMDCTLNDCGLLLKSIGQKEVYPSLILFPAERKDAISYQGNILVTDIIEFIGLHGRNSHHLSGNKDIIRKVWSWNPLDNVSSNSIHEQSSTGEGEVEEFLLNSRQVEMGKHQQLEPPPSGGSQEVKQKVAVGSVLTSSDKVMHAPPFDGSIILIVRANQEVGFLGLIINKRVGWDVFPDLDEDFEPFKQVPLFYGGPVVTHTMPLVSLSKKDVPEGYTEVGEGLYFGDQLVTSRAIEAIKSGNQSVSNYWFFLGYSGWGWSQLFHEIEEGAWHMSNYKVGHMDWPNS